MSEDFHTLLADLAQSAAASAHAEGSAAARRRGRQRAVRRRAAASVLSVVLIGGAGALGVLASQHSGAPAPITHSGTPTAPATGAPASPSTGTSPSASPSASASATAVTGDLHTIVPGAWTAANQFPFSSYEAWKANSSQPAIFTADRQWFYSCVGSNTLAHLGASGYQEKSYAATATGSHDSADQVLFFFPSTSAAQQALSVIENDYAHCPEMTTGLAGGQITGTVAQTETLDGGYAWLHNYRNAQGSPGDPADIASDNHEYFVQRGDVVELVWIGGAEAVDAQNEDLGFLNSLEANLCVYGGNCPASAHPLTATVTASGSTSLKLGGSAIGFTVTVTNGSDDTIKNITPIVSLAHCSCVNTPVPTMPKGVLQLWDTSSGSWKTLFYNTEGGGMDYLLSAFTVQVPGFDLAAGQSASFKYQLRLDPASTNTNLTGQFHLVNGTGAIDVTLVHPMPANGSNPVLNAQIGNSPTAKLPVTVSVN